MGVKRIKLLTKKNGLVYKPKKSLKVKKSVLIENLKKTRVRSNLSLSLKIVKNKIDENKQFVVNLKDESQKLLKELDSKYVDFNQNYKVFESKNLTINYNKEKSYLKKIHQQEDKLKETENRGFLNKNYKIIFMRKRRFGRKFRRIYEDENNTDNEDNQKKNNNKNFQVLSEVTESEIEIEEDENIKILKLIKEFEFFNLNFLFYWNEPLKENNNFQEIIFNQEIAIVNDQHSHREEALYNLYLYLFDIDLNDSIFENLTEQLMLKFFNIRNISEMNEFIKVELKITNLQLMIFNRYKNFICKLYNNNFFYKNFILTDKIFNLLLDLKSFTKDFLTFKSLILEYDRLCLEDIKDLILHTYFCKLYLKKDLDYDIVFNNFPNFVNKAMLQDYEKNSIKKSESLKIYPFLNKLDIIEKEVEFRNLLYKFKLKNKYIYKQFFNYLYFIFDKNFYKIKNRTLSGLNWVNIYYYLYSNINNLKIGMLFRLYNFKLFVETKDLSFKEIMENIKIIFKSLLDFFKFKVSISIKNNITFLVCFIINLLLYKKFLKNLLKEINNELFNIFNLIKSSFTPDHLLNNLLLLLDTLEVKTFNRNNLKFNKIFYIMLRQVRLFLFNNGNININFIMNKNYFCIKRYEINTYKKKLNIMESKYKYKDFFLNFETISSIEKMNNYLENVKYFYYMNKSLLEIIFLILDKIVEFFDLNFYEVEKLLQKGIHVDFKYYIQFIQVLTKAYNKKIFLVTNNEFYIFLINFFEFLNFIKIFYNKELNYQIIDLHSFFFTSLINLVNLYPWFNFFLLFESNFWLILENLNLENLKHNKIEGKDTVKDYIDDQSKVFQKFKKYVPFNKIILNKNEEPLLKKNLLNIIELINNYNFDTDLIYKYWIRIVQKVKSLKSLYKEVKLDYENYKEYHKLNSFDIVKFYSMYLANKNFDKKNYFYSEKKIVKFNKNLYNKVCEVLLNSQVRYFNKNKYLKNKFLDYNIINNYNSKSDAVYELEEGEDFETDVAEFYLDEYTEEDVDTIFDIKINIENLNKIYSSNSLICLKDLLDNEGNKLVEISSINKDNINDFLKEENLKSMISDDNFL